MSKPSMNVLHECLFCMKWSGNLEELRQHLEGNHTEFQLYPTGEDSQNLFILPNSIERKFKYFVLEDALFIFSQTYSEEGELIRILVEYVGDGRGGENYAYKILIRSKSCAYRGNDYTEFCTNSLLPFEMSRSLLESYDEPVISLEVVNLKL